MLSRIFPRQFDNAYRGYTLALWLFAPIALLKFAQGVASVVDARFIATTADRLPLDTFDAGAASTVAFMFMSWGLSTALLCLIGLIALVRYRAMIPLMYVVLAIEQIGRRVFLVLSPVPRLPDTPTDGPTIPINLILLAVLLIGLALSVGKTDEAGEGA